MDGGFAEHYVAFNDDEEEQNYHGGETEEGLRIQNFNDVDDSGGNDNDHRRGGGDSSAGKLFVGGLAWETTEGAFTNYFSKYGEVVDSVIMLDKISGRPRGFGFVTFADPVVADKVLEEDHVIDGRQVEVKKTVPREEMQVKGVGVQRTRKIFIGGIPPSFTDDELKEYFSSYGVVAEHQIMFDRETGRSRGFGFVTFQDEETVERIVSEGNIHELGGKEVEIKKAVPKRAGGDFNYDSRPRHGGSGSKSYGGGFSGGAGDYRGGRGGAGDYGGGRGGKASRGYGAYGGAAYGGGYGGNYGGAAAAAAAGFYGGYGGYGYGFGYWGGPMYNGGYGAGGFGPSAGYGAGGAIAGYGAASSGGGGAGAGYGGSKGYGSGGAGGGGGGSGGSGGGSSGGSGYGGGKGYGSSGGGGGKGYGNGGAASGRYHPY